MPVLSAIELGSKFDAFCLNSSNSFSTSISNAHKFCSVTTGVTIPLEKSKSNASPNEWAGSVDTINVRKPWSAKFIAIAELQDVFPTPPLPSND